MIDQLPAYALEFEVLISRAARRGRLDLEELIEPYGHLGPANHQRMASPESLDLDALVDALRRSATSAPFRTDHAHQGLSDGLH